MGRAWGILAAIVALGAGLLWSAAPASAAGTDMYVWTGASDGNWSNAANWSCSGPNCNGGTPITDFPSDVILPAQAVTRSMTLDQSATLNSLSIGSPTYTIGGLGQLTVQGTATLQGTLQVAQIYVGPVKVSGSVILGTTNNGVTFASTVDAADSNSSSDFLTVFGAGFNGDVGGGNPLAGLVVHGGQIGAISINTTGQQTYFGAITLSGSATLNATGGSMFPVNLSGSVDGDMNSARALTINGAASLHTTIGSVHPLTNVTISEAATLTGNTTIHAGVTTFDSKLDGGYPLAIGGGVFDGAVGSQTPLSSLSTTADTTFSGGSVDTTGVQDYSGHVTSGGEPVTLTASDVTVAGGASSLGPLTVNGGLTLSGGTFSAPSSTNLSGDFNATGATFTGNGGTLTMDGNGSSTQNLTSGGNTLANLAITNGAATAAQDPLNLSGTIDVCAGCALDLNGKSALASGLSGGGQINDSQTPSVLTLSPGAGVASTFTGVVDGAIGLVKSGPGTQTLDGGSSSYSQGTTISGGTLDLGTTGTPLGAGGLQATGGRLELSSSPTLTQHVTLGPGGLTVDTDQGTSGSLGGSISGSGALTKTGSGTLTLSGADTYAGLTNVQDGSLKLSGSLTGPLGVQSGGSAAVSGTAGGAVTVNSGSLTCSGGTLSAGKVINNGGTLTGGPVAPSNVSATAGVEKATVQFTPASASCLPTTFTVTATPGGHTASGSSSPLTVSGLANGTAYTFTVQAINPLGTSSPSSPSNQVRTPAPPAVTITAPANRAAYTRGQHVLAKYSCVEGQAGPGIRSCVGTAASGQPISTSAKGAHTFTVTAISKDGLKTVKRVTYTVR